MPIDLKTFSNEELLNELKDRLDKVVSAQADVNIIDDVVEEIKERKFNNAYILANSLVGLKEDPRKGHSNPVIDKMYDYIGHGWATDDDAWCAMFVGYCLKKEGLPFTGKLNARSYLDYGIETDSPEEGDLVIFWRHSKSDWRGHVGFFKEFDGDYIKTLGGNQDNMVNYKSYPKSQLLGFRKIPNETESKLPVVDKLEKNWQQEYEDMINNLFFSINFKHHKKYNSNVEYWIKFYKSLFYAECGGNPYAIYHEKTLGDGGQDPWAVKKGFKDTDYYSMGMFQLSYSDSDYYGAKFDWKADKNKDMLTDKALSIFKPELQIDAAMKIMERLLELKGTPFFDRNNYWLVLKPSRKEHAHFTYYYNRWAKQYE